MRSLVKRYRKFFNAQARRAKIASMPTINTPAQVHLAVMSAIAGIKQPQPNAIIKAVLEAGLDLETNEVYQSLVDYGAKDAFWQLVASASGYNEENISLLRVASHVLLTAITRTMKAENLGGLERYISLPHQARCYDLVSEWLHSDEKQSLYTVARQVEEELQLPNRFEKLLLSDLLETECFPCINEVILARLMRDIGNMIFSLEFYQKEAVSTSWSAETYNLYFADAAGHPISDTQKLIADKTDEDNRARTWRVTFNLKQQKYDQHTPYYTYPLCLTMRSMYFFGSLIDGYSRRMSA